MPEAMALREYDWMASFYDQLWRSYVTQTLTFLKGWAQIEPWETALDVACGTGAFAQMLLAEHLHQHIAGVDISAGMLALAQRKIGSRPWAPLQCARASALPFACREFDVIVSASSFHYFDDPLTVLSEMKRVSKPGGRLVLLDWCKDFRLCALCDLALSAVDPAHKQCYTQRELHGLLKRAGFKVRRARRVRFGMIWGLMAATAVVET